MLNCVALFLILIHNKGTITIPFYEYLTGLTTFLTTSISTRLNGFWCSMTKAYAFTGHSLSRFLTEDIIFKRMVRRRGSFFTVYPQCCMLCYNLYRSYFSSLFYNLQASFTYSPRLFPNVVDVVFSYLYNCYVSSFLIFIAKSSIDIGFLIKHPISSSGKSFFNVS